MHVMVNRNLRKDLHGNMKNSLKIISDKIKNNKNAPGWN